MPRHYRERKGLSIVTSRLAGKDFPVLLQIFHASSRADRMIVEATFGSRGGVRGFLHGASADLGGPIIITSPGQHRFSWQR